MTTSNTMGQLSSWNDFGGDEPHVYNYDECGSTSGQVSSRSWVRGNPHIKNVSDLSKASCNMTAPGLNLGAQQTGDDAYQKYWDHVGMNNNGDMYPFVSNYDTLAHLNGWGQVFTQDMYNTGINGCNPKFFMNNTFLMKFSMTNSVANPGFQLLGSAQPIGVVISVNGVNNRVLFLKRRQRYYFQFQDPSTQVDPSTGNSVLGVNTPLIGQLLISFTESITGGVPSSSSLVTASNGNLLTSSTLSSINVANTIATEIDGTVQISSGSTYYFRVPDHYPMITFYQSKQFPGMGSVIVTVGRPCDC